MASSDGHYVDVHSDSFQEYLRVLDNQRDARDLFTDSDQEADCPLEDPYHYKQYLQQITPPSLQSRNLTEEQAFRNLSESLAKQSPFRPMVDSMSSLRASFSYNPPSTMDSNGPEGSSFPSYLPASNTPPIDLTGAIPSLHTQTHDLHLVGSSSFLGDENTAFTPSEPVSRSDGEVLQLPSHPFHLLSSLSDSESSQGMNRSSRHSSPSLHPSHSRHSSPHCTHHCDVNGVLSYFTELLESDVDTSSILSVFSSISHCLLEDPSPSLSTPQLANVLREMMASRHSPVRIAG
ncbi:hypothetical protein WA588_004902, partial [Blastocystis sp. NMH]